MYVCLSVCQTRMAFKTKFLSVVVMAIVLAFLVVVQPPSDNGTGHGQLFGEEGTFRKIHNRKLVVSIKTKEEALRKDVNGSSRSKSSTSDAGKMVGWELRKVPSGPDPLHHNGGSPKKPTTP